MNPSKFTETYLRIDEDVYYVLKSFPCAFLGRDNYCFIYKIKAKACREFHHTDRKRQHQPLNITENNVEVCPAEYNILEKLKKKLVK